MSRSFFEISHFTLLIAKTTIIWFLSEPLGECLHIANEHLVIIDSLYIEINCVFMT